MHWSTTRGFIQNFGEVHTINFKLRREFFLFKIVYLSFLGVFYFLDYLALIATIITEYVHYFTATNLEWKSC